VPKHPYSITFSHPQTNLLSAKAFSTNLRKKVYDILRPELSQVIDTFYIRRGKTGTEFYIFSLAAARLLMAAEADKSQFS